MIHLSEDRDLVFEHLRVFDEAFVDNFDTAFRVGGLFEGGLVNCAVSSASDGLNVTKTTLGWNL